MKTSRTLCRYFAPIVGMLVLPLITSHAQTNCVAPVAGIVSWWRGENNAVDGVGTNHGILQNGTGFGSGLVGQALRFDGISNYVTIPASASLNVGSGEGLTIECWIKPAELSVARPLVEYNDGANYGVQLWISLPWFGNQGGPGAVFANIVDTGGGTHALVSAPGILTTNQFHHVAVTYDKASGWGRLYVGGVVVFAANLGTFTPRTSSNLLLGLRPAGSPNPSIYSGLMDEVSVYSRALTTNEIQAIYAAGSVGKCQPTPPTNCAPAPSGLVGWWRAEGNATDVQGPGVGSLFNGAGYAAGKVGQAFNFPGSGAHVAAPDRPGFHLTNALTVEAWVHPTAHGEYHSVISKWDVVFGPNQKSYSLAVHPDGRFYLGLCGDGNDAVTGAAFSTNALALNQWSHICGTYDGTAIRVYLNGEYQAQTDYGGGIFPGTNALGIGGLIGGGAPGQVLYGFAGRIDEPSLYSRALSQTEIQGIYAAGSAGKCLTVTAPYIISQPASQIVPIGSDVIFNVTAGGTAPLSYQWSFNGTNLAGATTSSLTKTNVQLNDAGNYAVLVSNIVGTVTSSNAVLTVNASQPVTLLNVNFAANQVKTGFAATGLTGSDFWNELWFPFEPSAGLGGLKQADGTATATGLTVQNGAGHTGFAHPDLMYQSCCYAQDFGVITLTVTNLPTGAYDVYLYGHAGDSTANTVFQLLVGGNSFGNQSTATNSSWSSTNWVEGAQYVVYRGVVVTNGGAPLIVKCHPGVSGYTYLNGFQIRAAGSTPPVIVSQPTSQGVLVGADVTFNVTAGGTAPLSYQWSFNGTNLAGATTSSLTKTNVQLGDAGNYTVVVSNSVGTVISSNAMLTVNPPPPCVPPGLVSWWQFEGTADDNSGQNQGTLINGASFASGKVGQSLSFDGQDDFVSIPASTSLDVGVGEGLTLECWINPSDLSRSQAIAEWNDGMGGIGVLFWHSDAGLGGLGSLLVNLPDTFGSSHILASPQNLLLLNAFQHIAMTYDKATGVGKIFHNGLAVTTQSLGSFSPRTSYALYFGTRVSGPAAVGSYYAGLMDETSVYNRALTAAEIQAIYNAGSAGKCSTPSPPFVFTQPTNQTVVVGADVTFNVTAGGTAPLSYQWSFNGTNLAGATTSSLTKTNVHLGDAGNYTVVVSNSVGTVTSSNAVLTVNPPPACVPPASGLVSWWPAEGDANDTLGGNHGALAGGVVFGAAKVGQGFNFNGSDAIVSIAASSRLDVGTGGGLTIEAWIRPASATESMPVVEWNSGSGGNPYGVHLWTSVGSAGNLFANIVDTAGNYHGVQTAPGLLTANTFQHVALSYDKATGQGKLYLNGQAVGLENLGSFTPQTSYNCYFGFRPAGGVARYAGDLDEVALYSRALSDAEIQAIYNAGSAGKCSTPTPPFVFTQPTNQTVSAGDSVTFAVLAGGTPPMSYQWNFNSQWLVNATNASLTISNVGTNHSGGYAVTVSNSFGATVSSNANLTVLVFPPSLILQPTNQIRVAGETATLLATASGTAPLSYQWSFNGDTLHGATNASLVFPNVGTDRAGVYAVTVRNFFGSETSSNATLAVVFLTTNLFDDFDLGIDFPQWSGFGGTVQATNHGGFVSPSNSLWFGGTGSRFAVTRSINTTNSWDLRFHLRFANGFSPLWDRPELPNDGVVLEYSTNLGANWVEFGRYNTTTFYNWTPVSALIPAGAKVPAARFRWRQLANSGSISDHWALDDVLLTEVATPPLILDQPQSQTVNAGGTAVFLASVDGSSPLNYQWRVGGTDIPGATNSLLILSDVQPSQAGDYSLHVANVAGVAVSSNAVLKVTVVSALGNGQLLTEAVHYFSSSMSVALTNYFPGGLIFYTLNGSAPSFASSQYLGPFQVSQTVVLRAIGYRADFLESGELGPITILKVPGFTLSVSSAGGGSITLNPPGGDYSSNTVVSLTAVPDPGWTFFKWLGDADGSSGSTNVTVTRNKAVQAVFGTTLNTTAAGGGSVALNPPGGDYAFGSVVQITAVPNPGNFFGIWGSAASGNVNPLLFTVTNPNPTVSSIFGAGGSGQAALTVVPVGRGQVSINPRANIYPTNSAVTITATPDAGQSFLGWSGNANGTQNPLQLTLDSSKLIYANFTRRPQLTAEMLLNEGFRLSLMGDGVATYRLEMSTNLAGWETLAEITNAVGTAQFIDQAATNSIQRFYRALMLP